MKAPEKICVAPHQISDFDLDIQEVGHNGAEEYIRKDALLEWMDKMRKKHKGFTDVELVITFNALIDKLNSL